MVSNFSIATISISERTIIWWEINIVVKIGVHLHNTRWYVC